MCAWHGESAGDAQDIRVAPLNARLQFSDGVGFALVIGDAGDAAK